MSANLDMSLGEIISNRKTAPRGRGRARGKTTATTPTNGIRKNVATRSQAKPAAKPTGPAPSLKGNSKIIVSGLPSDVNETQIKEYFATSLKAPVKRVDLTYGPNGVSRGTATILFGNPTSASEAAKQMNGVKVDGRPMRVEVVLDAAAAAAPVSKSLSDRVAKPKDQPRKAGTAKVTENAAKGSTRGGARGGRGATRGGRGARAPRPKRKTADELDAEMTDYFGVGGAPAEAAAPADNGAPAAAPAATGGDDMGMEEI